MDVKTAADLLVQILISAGVKAVFGLPGDGINGIMEALRKRRDDLPFIQVRHEEAAALAAVGYAKFTGEIGLCLATTGPGAVHLLNGLYDAKLDQVPVLAITGLPYHDLVGTHYQQDVATDRLFADVSVYSERIMGPLHVESVVHQALRTARSRRGVAHVAFPIDFQDQGMKDDSPSKINAVGHSSVEYRAPVVVPMPDDLRKAADVLNSGKRLFIVIGSGARGAADELEQLAELRGAPIGKALLGKDVLPDQSPFTTGTMGILGTAGSADAVEAADTLLLIGTRFPYISYLPKPGQVRAVQIDTCPENISLRHPVEVGLVGDAKRTLQQLLPLIDRAKDQSFLRTIQATMAEWWRVMETRGTSTESPMRPQVVAWTLGKLISDDALVCVDCGQNTFHAARHIRIREGQRFTCSGLLATMGNAVPYAIGAQIAYPGRQVVALVGDGGMTMTLGELATCAKYKLPIKIVVLKNNVLGMIRWEQMMFMGNPEYGVELQDIDFTRVAEGFGIRSVRVAEASELEAALRTALAEEGPVLIEAVVDPHEPLVPGKIREEQAENYAQALRNGQPAAKRIGLTLFRAASEDVAHNREVLQDALGEETPGELPEGDR